MVHGDGTCMSTMAAGISPRSAQESEIISGQVGNLHTEKTTLDSEVGKQTVILL